MGEKIVSEADVNAIRTATAPAFCAFLTLSKNKHDPLSTTTTLPLKFFVVARHKSILLSSGKSINPTIGSSSSSSSVGLNREGANSIQFFIFSFRSQISICSFVGGLVGDSVGGVGGPE